MSKGKPMVYERCPYPVVNESEALDHFERIGSIVKAVLHEGDDGFMRGYALVIPRE